MNHPFLVKARTYPQGELKRIHVDPDVVQARNKDLSNKTPACLVRLASDGWKEVHRFSNVSINGPSYMVELFEAPLPPIDPAGLRRATLVVETRAEVVGTNSWDDWDSSVRYRGPHPTGYSIEELLERGDFEGVGDKLTQIVTNRLEQKFPLVSRDNLLALSSHLQDRFS